ncbi:MAG: hypothetical protein KY455_09165 [Euryarchaeota archaeon]|nr:hypothetical protein [Euryarchaeota archaeon]
MTDAQVEEKASHKGGNRLGDLGRALPGVRGEGLVPLRMDPPGLAGGLEPISFVAGLDPLSEELLRDGRTVPVRPVGEQGDLDKARKRATDLGLTE